MAYRCVLVDALVWAAETGPPFAGRDLEVHVCDEHLDALG